jgi:hypothetical protein
VGIHVSQHCVGARVSARASVLKAFLSSGVAAGALATVLVAGLAWPPSEAAAQCAPVANAAGPSNTTITCSGIVTNQNSPNGYGTGNQNNDTINVTAGTRVTGNASFVSDGFLLGTGNTVNNNGTVTGNLVAIQGSGAPGDITVNNSGTITSATGDGIFADTTTGTANVTNNAGATINPGGIAITGATVNLMNSGTVSTNNMNSAVAGQKSTMITNNASGTITNAGAGAFAIASGSGGMNLTNFGMIQETAGSNNIGLFSTGATTVMISGTIQVTGTSAIQATAIFTTSGTTTITNNPGGVIQATSPNSIGLVAASSTASAPAPWPRSTSIMAARSHRALTDRASAASAH